MLNSNTVSAPQPAVAGISGKAIDNHYGARARLGNDFLKFVPVMMDTLLAVLAFEMAKPLSWYFWESAGEYTWQGAVADVFILTMAFYLNEMYCFWQPRRTAELITIIVRSQGLTMVVLAPTLMVFPWLLGAWEFGMVMCVQSVLLLGWRTLLERGLICHLARQRVLIVGSGARAMRIREAMRDKGCVIFELVGCTVDRVQEDTSSSVSCRTVGPTLEVSQFVQSEKIDHVVVAQDNPRKVFPAEALLMLKRQGVAVSEGEYFYERLMGKLMTDYVRPSVMIFTASPMHHTVQIWIKNVVDFTVAMTLLILTLPITIATAIIIKLTSKGPIFYNQERVGMNGKPFTIYKFRSMRTDAEKDGAKWATQNDNRITPIGKFIRKTRIDELPQLVNVLKGEMSMVGPRPERPLFVKKLQEEIPYYDMRHIMRPGLSGWAQVRYRYGSSIEDSHEKLRYDLYYIKNYTLFLDLTILLETTKVVLFGSGAR